MKKDCFMFLIAAALLTGCGSEEDVAVDAQKPDMQKQTETTTAVSVTGTTAAVSTSKEPITFATLQTTAKPMTTTAAPFPTAAAANASFANASEKSQTEPLTTGSGAVTVSAAPVTTAAVLTEQTMLNVRTSFTTMTVTNLMRRQTTYLFTEPVYEPEEPDEPQYEEPARTWYTTFVYTEDYILYDLSVYQSVYDNTLFIGDSTVYGLRRVDMLKKDLIAGLVEVGVRDAMHTPVYVDGSEIDVFTAAKKTKAKNIVCSFGLNDVNRISEKKFTSAYRELLDNLKAAAPDAHISVVSIPPVLHSNEKYSNDKIDRYNQALAAFCEDYGCQYIDITPDMKNVLNGLKNDYHRGDGIHLSLDGYGAFLWQIGAALDS